MTKPTAECLLRRLNLCDGTNVPDPEARRLTICYCVRLNGRSLGDADSDAQGLRRDRARTVARADSIDRMWRLRQKRDDW